MLSFQSDTNICSFYATLDTDSHIDLPTRKHMPIRIQSIIHTRAHDIHAHTQNYAYDGMHKLMQLFISKVPLVRHRGQGAMHAKYVCTVEFSS